jgi:S-formylglutathione hydrolase FrmB
MIEALKKDKRPRVVICGKNDFFLAENRTALAACQAAGVELNWRDTEGGHDWKYWSRELPLVAKTFSEAARK